MKVKDVIEYMKEYNPEDELLVMWWDSDVLYNDNDTVSKEEWNKIIDQTDGYGFDGVNQDIYEILEETLFDIRKEAEDAISDAKKWEHSPNINRI